MEKDICLVGLTPYSINKGCEALTFSFIQMLHEIAFNKDIYFVVEFQKQTIFKFDKQRNTYIINNIVPNRIHYLYYRVVKNRLLWLTHPPKNMIVIDFTQGDSFTDIYGNKRFNDWTLIKEYFISNFYDFIIGSQTIGPFNSQENKFRAKKILQASKAVFVRDNLSYDYVKYEMGLDSTLTTDVAFFLPYDDTGYKKTNRIGFNPSGLLWNGGYTTNNQFNLSLDYREFCRKCISSAITKGLEVHLIGHVISEDFNVIDNDYSAIKVLHDEFPETIVAPIFDTPMEAKTYISNMAAFTGARMHATIASISSGVPVLPFSYSRKFEGLFKTLQYDHMIHGKEDDTEKAVNKFENFVNHIGNARNDVLVSQKIIDKMKNTMLSDYKNVIERVET